MTFKQACPKLVHERNELLCLGCIRLELLPVAVCEVGVQTGDVEPHKASRHEEWQPCHPKGRRKHDPASKEERVAKVVDVHAVLPQSRRVAVALGGGLLLPPVPLQLRVRVQERPNDD